MGRQEIACRPVGVMIRLCLLLTVFRRRRVRVKKAVEQCVILFEIIRSFHKNYVSLL